MVCRFCFSIGTGALVLALIYLVSRLQGVVSTPILHPSTAATMGFALVSVVVVRIITLRLASLPRLKRRVLVLGAGERALRIERFAQDNSRCGFLPVAFHPIQDEPIRVSATGCPIIPTRLRDLARSLRVNEVVVAADDRNIIPEQALIDCRLSGCKVSDYLSFWERATGRVEVDQVHPSWLIFSDGFHGGRLHETIKRLFDVVVASIFLIVTLPLIAVTAIAIRCDSPGPVLYRQERIGRNGRPFMLNKFRSMTMDAESNGDPQWAAINDKRITRVGGLIRKTRIDEIPQVFNVLAGDMSFIGPRPERPFFVRQLSAEIPYYDERHRVKPGITGWAQINYPYGASIEDAREKLCYDLYYMKNYSLLLDVLILLATVRVVLSPDSAR